jgi:hypothetical protein
MARKSSSPSELSARLHGLSQSVDEEIRLPSLCERPARVQGYAFRFFLVLPLYTATGNRVFTDEHITQLLAVFDNRFGGCLATSSRSGAPFFGEYLPEGTVPVRDYHTVIIVYASPSDRFFRELKLILRAAPLVEQEEILVERSEVYLL